MKIEARHLETIRQILSARVPGCEARAFGSRVKGTNKKHSDLDIALVSPDGKKLGWRVVPSLTLDFQESRVPFRVDVLDWHAVPESFRKIIEQKYEIIFPKEP